MKQHSHIFSNSTIVIVFKFPRIRSTRMYRLSALILDLFSLHEAELKNLQQWPPQPILGNKHPLSFHELIWNSGQILISWFPTSSLVNVVHSFIHKIQQKAKIAIVRKEANLGLGRQRSISSTLSEPDRLTNTEERKKARVLKRFIEQPQISGTTQNPLYQ